MATELMTELTELTNFKPSAATRGLEPHEIGTVTKLIDQMKSIQARQRRLAEMYKAAQDELANQMRQLQDDFKRIVYPAPSEITSEQVKSALERLPPNDC
jgi:hypothetical protein